MKKFICCILVFCVVFGGCSQFSSGDIKEKTDVTDVESTDDEQETDESEDDEIVEDDGETVEDDGEIVEDDGETVEDDGETVEDDGEIVEDDGEIVEDDDSDVEPVMLNGVFVSAKPAKRMYRAGESIDLSGLEISCTYSDGTSVVSAEGSYTVSGVDTALPGRKNIDISLDGFTTTLHVFVYTENDLMRVTGGSFTMGSDIDSYADNPSHSITVSDYFIARTETTYAAWRVVYEWALSCASPYTFANAGKEGNDGVVGAVPVDTGLEPVTYIDWLDATVWCNAASEKEGLTPVFYTDSLCTTVLRTSKTTLPVYVNWAASGYRLPTEAEWEWAAGGGPDPRTIYAGTDDVTLLPNFAWYPASCRAAGNEKTTYPTGTKEMNGYGLFDMSGNVTEWCYDWYDASWYSVSTPNNPSGPDSVVDPYRVIRGSSFSGSIIGCAVAARNAVKYSSKSGSYGFRVARNAP